MHRFFLGLAAMVALIPQPQQSSSGQSVALGKPIVLADGVTLTVTTGSSRSAEAFGPAGKAGLVIDLQFETNTYTTIRLEPSSDATKSEIVLDAGGQRVAPAALTNYSADKPSTPTVVRVAELTPMPTTGRGYFSWVAFTGKGVVSLLFDVPEAKPGVKTLLLEIELGDRSHKLLVTW